MSVSLRPYQTAAHDALRSAWRAGRKSQMIVLPTGCGKTITALHIAASFAKVGRRVLWLAHREELLDQPARTLAALWPWEAEKSGIVQADRDESDALICFASVATLARGPRLARVLEEGPPALVVVDEAHHSAARSWAKILDEIGPTPYRLGMTATPDRADGQALGGRWEVAYSYPIGQAIDDGYLCPPRIEVDRVEVDLAAIATRGGDYDASILGERLLEAGVVEKTAQVMGEMAAGRKSLVFTVTVRQAVATAAALCEAGIPAAALDGTATRRKRRAILAAFAAGEIRAIANCGVLTEGYDEPSADCVVIARPTRSKALYVQCVGRGLRLYPGKTDCLVLDLAGASEEHSLLSAGALLGEDVDPGWPQRFERPEGAPPQEATDEALYGGMMRSRSRAALRWSRVASVDREAWVVSCGAEGTLALVARPDSGGYDALILRRRKTDRLASTPVDLELAQGLAHDYARQAGALGLSRARAGWRRAPPSSAQLAQIARLAAEGHVWGASGQGDLFGVPEPKSKGEASSLITRAIARRLLVRRRLVAVSG